MHSAELVVLGNEHNEVHVMDEKILKAASELVETVEKYLKQGVSRSILCLKLAALKKALQEEQPV